MDEGICNRWQAYQAEMMEKLIYGKRIAKIWIPSKYIFKITLTLLRILC